jgi:hypothetical protein
MVDSVVVDGGLPPEQAWWARFLEKSGVDMQSAPTLPQQAYQPRNVMDVRARALQMLDSIKQTTFVQKT